MTMKLTASYTLSHSNESCEAFDGFTSGDVALAQTKIHKRKCDHNDDAFSSGSEYSKDDSEGSTIETSSDINSNDELLSSDEVSHYNDVPSEYEIGEHGEHSDTNIPTDSDSDEADSDVDVVDTNNIIGHLGEGSDMMELLNMPMNWTQDLKPIVMNPFTKQTGLNLPEDFNVTKATPKDYFSLFFY